VARASVLATRKKSASPMASLAASILSACSSAGTTWIQRNGKNEGVIVLFANIL